MKKIEFSGKAFDFNYFDESKCWITNFEIEGIKINLEIDMECYKQETIDWRHLEEFLKYISSQNRLSEFLKHGIRPIEEVGFTFFRRCRDEIKNWHMIFSNSILFEGYPEGVNTDKDFYFSLVYDFAEEKDNIFVEGDAYGLYLVDIISSKGIIGSRRIQC
ncbi:hypothetical protein [Flammeovirga aprica]|uniref:Uncharacterized protein n=1 Tax=Flammeovirga aprica JL-4 TaxID=694437 RepID=A0A7X9RYR1_9BACT|nr:hypothetical protein [Flammeovirga aprica]NME71252.1 hypothetical protein [Flammeovirga aprica JL-4]